MQFLIDNFYLIFSLCLIVITLVLMALSFHRPSIRCRYCNKKMSAREFEVHFCREKYIEFSKAAAKKSGGTVHSVRFFTPGIGWKP
jgi:hypothetical protein